MLFRSCQERLTIPPSCLNSAQSQLSRCFFHHINFFLFYYCISDIVIYLIYIDLMRKCCQLNVDDVDVDRKRDAISIHVLKELSADYF